MKDFPLFIESLSKLISYPSEKGMPEQGKPFGKAVYDAYEYFNSLAKSFGFETIDYDGYIGEAVYGDGEEIGIIGHLDVVPAGGGWNTPPYTLTKLGDTYYARGIVDDKAPLLLCLFALKELKDTGVTPKKKIRLIFGCNEESGWEDVAYLNTKTTLPEYGFSPDGDFPVSYAEKGIGIIEFAIPALKNFYGIKGGTVINAVCDYASVKCKTQPDLALVEKFGLKYSDGIIESFGKSAHGSKPELGKNALKPLFEFFSACGEEVTNVIDYLFNDKAGIFKMQNEQGNVTFSPDLIEERDGKIYIKCDCRFPAPFEFSEIVAKLDTFGIDYTYIIKHDTQFVPKDSEIIKTLLAVYNEVTGENKAPLSMGGSTFGRVFKKGCAFGPEFEGVDTHIHEPNECISEKQLLDCYEIYKGAIFGLAGVKNR